MTKSAIPGVKPEVANTVLQAIGQTAEDIAGKTAAIEMLTPFCKRLEEKRATEAEIRTELNMVFGNPGVRMALGLSSHSSEQAEQFAEAAASALAKEMPEKIAGAFFAKLEEECSKYMESDVFNPKYFKGQAQVVELMTQKAIRERNALPAVEAIRTPLLQEGSEAKQES